MEKRAGLQRLNLNTAALTGFEDQAGQLRFGRRRATDAWGNVS